MENLVYIGNLSFKCSQDDLYKSFHNFGPIKRIKLFSIQYQNFYYPVGYACIQFSDNNGYKKCLSFDKNFNLYNKKIIIYSQKPETSFSRSIFAFFFSDNIDEEYIYSYFQYNQPLNVNVLLKPTINNYGFAIVEFSSMEHRDIILYEYFRSQSLKSNTSRYISNPITMIEPPANLIELSFTSQPQNNAPFAYYQNDSMNEINNNDSSSISFSPSGITYFENKYYERYLDLSIVHNNKEYRVNSFLSSTFSIRIRQLLMENSIIEKVSTRFNKDGPFELISNSLLGLPVDITNQNSVFLFIASSDLEIESLQKSTYGYVFNQMTIEKAFDMHHYLRNFNVYEGPHSDFLSLHFDLILPNLNALFSENENSEENDQLHELRFLAAILRSKFFTVRDQSVFSQILLQFIKEKDGKDDLNQRRKFLIQFLKMKEMGIEEAKTVIDDESINLNQISEPIFSFLKEKSKEVTSQNQPNQIGHQIDHCLDIGVFSKLYQICQCNPHDSEVVKVTSSSCLDDVIDCSESKSFEWISSDIENSWICVNFQENPIVLSSYALKYQEDYNNGFDSNDDSHSNQLVSWLIEGSNDFENWILLDQRKNDEFDENESYDSYSYSFSPINDGNNDANSLKKRKRKRKENSNHLKKFTRFKWKVFNVELKNEDAFKFIRLTQIGKNKSGNYRLKIQGIEFYGSMPSQQIELLYGRKHSKFQKGIFSFLFDSFDGENPAKDGTISISSSCDAKFLIDENYDGYWCSSLCDNAFVKIDLKKMKLELKSYSLACHNGNENEFIKSWIIEVSNDDENWILVDKRENVDDYKSPYENLFWECKSPYVDPIRYIRIVNINKENPVFCLAHIELYGILHRI